MKSVAPFVVLPDQYPRALNVLGIKVTLLATRLATGDYEITLQQGEAGVGPPPHSHAWDESFFVLRGRVDFDCAGRSTQAVAGTLVHVPAGTVHAFTFGPDGGAMIEFTGSGTTATRMFASVEREIPPEIPDMSKLLDVLAQNGVVVAA